MDKESNCLNDKAACFKADKTAPQLDKAILPLPYQPGNNTISTLASVDLMFSEELNNPKPTDFVFSGPGAANGITVNAIEKIGSFQYRLHVTASLDTGDIFLDFSDLKDYNGNKISGPTQVHYYGNVDITVPIVSVNHYGVSTGGYPSIAVSWRHNYTPILAGNTLYTIGLTTGSSDCNGATMVAPVTPDVVADTPLGSGAHVSPFDAANPVTTTHSFTLNTSVITSLGAQVILICVKNASNNKRGSAAISVVRDDSAPATTISPLEGPYATAKPVTFTCSDNVDRVIYNVGYTSGTGFDPSAAAIADPTFNASTGAITNGTEYNSAAKPTTPYFVNPTHSIFKYRCIDRAGNIEAVKTSQVYVIDSNLPEVTISKIYKSGTTREITGLSSQAGAYQSADIVWSTNQVNKPWTLRHSSTNCTNGSVVTSGVTPLSGTTPLTANQAVPMPAALLFDSTGISAGVNTLRLCVQNGALYGQDVLSVIRDDTSPTVSPNVAGGNYGSTQSLQFLCSDNADVIAYDVASADGVAVPAPPTDPAFSADGTQISGLPFSAPLTTPNQKTSVYKWRCIDKSGNKSASVGTATYVIDSMVPTITIVSNTYSVLGTNAPQNTTALSWKSSYPSRNYEVRVGGADCSTGTLIAGPTLTPADTNTAVVTNIGQASLVEGANTVRICVENYTGLSGMKGFTTQVLTKDTTAPTIPNQAATIAAVDATNFTLTIPAASDVGSGIAGYRVYRTDTISYPAFPILPTYTVTTSPATIQMPTTAKYYLKVVPFDGAGNMPTAAPLAYTELTTKPTIKLVVQGLSGSITVTDGAVSLPVNADIAAPGNTWSTTLGTGSPYVFNITAQPAGQVCSIKEKQYGTLGSDMTITINCVNGYMVGGRFQSATAAGINPMLYRTRADVWVSSFAVAGELPNSVAVAGGYVYYGTDGDCDAGAPVRYCIYRVAVGTAGSQALFVNNIPAVIRGMATDGTNLYFTTINPDNRLYKVPLSGGAPVEITSGLNNPFGIVLDGTDVYVCNRGASQIARVDVLTGTITSVASGVFAPLGISIVGNQLYITQFATHAISRVPKTGGSLVTAYGASGIMGATDGFGTAARLNEPHDLVYDGVDNLFVSEYANHTVRRIRLSTGRVSTLVGDSTIVSMTYTNGTGPVAKLPRPVGITTDGRNLYISLHGDRRIVKLTEQNLKGYWPLDFQTTGNLTDYAPDNSTANNATFVLTSDSSAADRFGNAAKNISFAGSERLTGTMTNLPLGSTARTMCTWVKPTTFPAGNSVVATYGATNNNQSFGLYATNLSGTIYVGLTAYGGVPYDLTVPYALSTTLWTHLCAWYNGAEARVYANGHLIVSGSRSGGSAFNTQPGGLSIGAQQTGTEFFNGAIADVRIYSRALGEGEINELAQDAGGTGQVGSSYNTGGTGLLSHFEFTAGSFSDSGSLNLTVASGTGTLVAGKDGDTNGGYRFSGSQFLTTTSGAGLPIGSHPRTMCAWTKTETHNFGWYTGSVAYGTSTGGTPQFSVYSLAYNIGSPGTHMIWGDFGDIGTTRVPNINTWTHICATYDGSTNRIYENGTEIVNNNAVTPNTQAGALRIGCWVNGANCIIGSVDDVRIYNNALSAAQIRQLALQVPSGLVARYDLDADTNDVSGFGNSMTNSGATQTDDRFGMNNTAHKFNGSGNTMSAGAVTHATNSATFAVWVKPAAVPAAFTGIFDNYNGTSGVGGSGGGFIINGSGQLSFFSRGGVDQDCTTTYTLPVDVYTHLAATQSVSPANISIYVNGSLVSSCAPSATPSIFNNSQPLRLGKSIWANTFNGNIDDARLYNRALTQAEVQALVQQPNKRIYVTNNVYNGNLGGIAGADAKCNAVDANKPSASGTFKALLVDSGASLLRRACTMQNCTGGGGVSQSIDWVLRPNITYLRGLDRLPVFTANFNGVFDFGAGSFTNAIHTTSFTVWTGINFGIAGQWTIDGGPGQCNSWTGNGTNGVYGDSAATAQTASATPTGAIYNGFEILTCITARRLYCVEQ